MVETIKLKYPLTCGCRAKDYWSMCDNHKAEFESDAARVMGIADLRFNHRDFTDLPRLAQVLNAIKLQLITNPTKSCLIKIIPDHAGEQSDPFKIETLKALDIEE